MENYISQSLASGLIAPLSFPFGAGFFFVKKDGTLRLCVDYCGLNKITVRNKYHLPLLKASFAPLEKARIFLKTPIGRIEYWVMPFGLTNAPAVSKH